MFENVKKLGFGAMRLPKKNDEPDLEAFSKMVDAFMAAGFTYFDTAHPYHGGKSEPALKACLTSRYPRESYMLTDKISGSCFEKEEDVRPYFDEMLNLCGVEYFDFVLMHAQNKKNFEKFMENHVYDIAQELKAEGKVRHVGISFHDTAEYLEHILQTRPEIEVVQLQFNYLDYEDENVQSRKCYEVCCRYGKPVLVMEPVKGGTLARLPLEAKAVYDQLGSASPASYALRYVAGFENVVMILSGMSDMEQLQDNMATFSPMKPLDETEQAAVNKVVEILRTTDLVACTNCRYCVAGCPQEIKIPDWFTKKNAKIIRNEDLPDPDGGTPADCVGCGQCEEICPQKLKIRELLEKY